MMKFLHAERTIALLKITTLLTVAWLAGWGLISAIDSAKSQPVSAPGPFGGIPVTVTATGTTAATAATLPAVSTRITYLCGFSIRANATAAATGNATVAGTVTGTLNFTQWTAPLASGIGLLEPPLGGMCIPASAINTGIVITSAAPGAGGTVSVTAWGYQSPN